MTLNQSLKWHGLKQNKTATCYYSKDDCTDMIPLDTEPVPPSPTFAVVYGTSSRHDIIGPRAEHRSSSLRHTGLHVGGALSVASGGRSESPNDNETRSSCRVPRAAAAAATAGQRRRASRTTVARRTTCCDVSRQRRGRRRLEAADERRGAAAVLETMTQMNENLRLRYEAMGGGTVYIFLN